MMPLCASSSMLRLPVVSRSLFPAAITKGGAATANNNGKNTPVYQLCTIAVYNMCLVFLMNAGFVSCFGCNKQNPCRRHGWIS